MTNRIKNYRRIGNWENFFFDSAVYSLAEFTGTAYDNGFTPIAAITGDLFAFMYADNLPCDSGLTNYVILPERAKKAFASFGWECDFISRDDILRDLPAAAARIRASIDRGLPVLAWGVGGVPGMPEGMPMGEGALIGGYDDDVLLVHLYCGAERLPSESFGGRPGVDADGYTAIPAASALAGSDGVFILTEKIPPTPAAEICRDVLAQMPRWLTMPPTGGRVSDTAQYSFGKAAFDRWAAVLRDDAAWQDCDEGVIWDKHCSAFCALCTSIGAFDGDSRAVDWLRRAGAVAILPHFCRMSEYFQEIWSLHGGFMPSAESMRQRSYRENIAAVLDKMGGCCDDILRAL